MERIGPLFGDGREGPGKIGLDQGLAPLERSAVSEEHGSARRPPSEAVGGAGQRIGEPALHGNPVPGQGAGGSDEIGEGEASRPVEAVRLGQSAHGARDTDGLAGADGCAAIGLPVGREEHVRRRRGGCRLAKIDGHGLAGGGETDEHEPAAAEIARLRQRHREGEAHRHGGIHGVAPTLQDRDTDPGRKGILRGHHAVSPEDGEDAGIVRRDRGQFRDRLREGWS